MTWSTLKAAFLAWLTDAAGGATVIFGNPPSPQPALPFATVTPLGLVGAGAEAKQAYDPGAQAWRHVGEGLGTFVLAMVAGGPLQVPIAKRLHITIEVDNEPLRVQFDWGDQTVRNVELVEDEAFALGDLFDDLEMVTITPVGKNPGGFWVIGEEYFFEASHFGAEVELSIAEPQYLSLSVQAHAADEFSATELAGALKLALERDATRASLYAAGASVVDSGTIKSVGKLVDAGKKGIAVFDPRFLVKGTTSERVPYIAKVVITPTTQSPGHAPVAGQPFEVDVEQDP